MVLFALACRDSCCHHRPTAFCCPFCGSNTRGRGTELIICISYILHDDEEDDDGDDDNDDDVYDDDDDDDNVDVDDDDDGDDDNDFKSFLCYCSKRSRRRPPTSYTYQPMRRTARQKQG